MEAGATHVDEIEARGPRRGGRADHHRGLCRAHARGGGPRDHAAAEGNAAAAVDAAHDLAAVAGTAVVHAEAAEGVRAATAQQEERCRMVAEATGRLTSSAGDLRGLVGGLRVAPREEAAADWSDGISARPRPRVLRPPGGGR